MLLVLVAVMLAIAAKTARHLPGAGYFTMSSRRFDAWVAALGYTGGIANAWVLTLMCAAAFSLGLSALWLWLAVLAGCALNLWFVVPGLHAATLGQGHVTLLQVLFADIDPGRRPAVVYSTIFIMTVTLLLLASAALGFGADVLQAELAFAKEATIALALILIVMALFSGAQSAANMCDAVQTILLFAAAVLLLSSLWIAAGGWRELWIGLGDVGADSLDVFGGAAGVVAIAFVAGAMGLGLGVSGQVQALNRCIEIREEAVGRFRRIAIAWIAVLLGVVLLCGWCARVMYTGLADPRQAMIAISMRLLPLWAGGVLVLAVTGAVMLSAANLLATVCTSCVLDLRRSGRSFSLARYRGVLLVAAVLSYALATCLPGSGLDRGFFAFTALGASFGPLLLVRLSGKRIRTGSTLGAMWSGFVLSLLFHLLPDTPGDFMERVLPFIAALGIALGGGERRRNPNRADRSEETMHDRLPI